MIPLLPNVIILLPLGIASVIISSAFKPNFSAGKEYKEWMITFLVFILISTLWSIKPILTVYTLIINVLPIFCLTYSISRYIDSYTRLIEIFKLIFIAGIVSIIYLYLFVDLTMLAGSRISAAMTDENLAENWNSNSIGMNFALTIWFGYIIVRYENKFIYWVIWIILSIVMLVAILLTGSRKAIMLLLIPFFIFALYDYKKHFLKAVMLIFAAGGVLWMALNIPFFYDIIGKRIDDMINIISGNETGYEDNSRKDLILFGLDWFSQRPILGYGMNCFRVLSDSVPRFAGKNFYAHNNYIEILVGGGLIGLSVYYYYMLLLLRRLRHHREIFFRYTAIIITILLLMDFAQVSYYDVIMQMLIVFAFILVRLKN